MTWDTHNLGYHNEKIFWLSRRLKIGSIDTRDFVRSAFSIFQVDLNDGEIAYQVENRGSF